MHQDLKELQKLIGCRLCKKTFYRETSLSPEQLYIELCSHCADFYSAAIEESTEKINKVEFYKGEDVYYVRLSISRYWLTIRRSFDTTLAPPHRALLDEIDDFCK